MVYLGRDVDKPQHTDDLVFDLVDHDRSAAYNNVTGAWTAPDSAIYHFNVHMWTRLPKGTRLFLSLYVNGINRAWTYSMSGPNALGNFATAQINTQLKVSAGQKVTVRANSAGAVNSNSDNRDMESWFGGNLLELL